MNFPSLIIKTYAIKSSTPSSPTFIKIAYDDLVRGPAPYRPGSLSRLRRGRGVYGDRSFTPANYGRMTRDWSDFDDFMEGRGEWYGSSGAWGVPPRPLNPDDPLIKQSPNYIPPEQRRPTESFYNPVYRLPESASQMLAVLPLLKPLIDFMKEALEQLKQQRQGGGGAEKGERKQVFQMPQEEKAQEKSPSSGQTAAGSQGAGAKSTPTPSTSPKPPSASSGGGAAPSAASAPASAKGTQAPKPPQNTPASTPAASGGASQAKPGTPPNQVSSVRKPSGVVSYASTRYSKKRASNLPDRPWIKQAEARTLLDLLYRASAIPGSIGFISGLIGGPIIYSLYPHLAGKANTLPKPYDYAYAAFTGSLAGASMDISFRMLQHALFR